MHGPLSRCFVFSSPYSQNSSLVLLTTLPSFLSLSFINNNSYSLPSFLPSLSFIYNFSLFHSIHCLPSLPSSFHYPQPLPSLFLTIQPTTLLLTSLSTTSLLSFFFTLLTISQVLISHFTIHNRFVHLLTTYLLYPVTSTPSQHRHTHRK